ncbi:hypothetical protein AXG93_1028s1030 [Marchantia polymorpha subsp. ruderalis]|uniref:Uncharacterized protein n=1 Tax=Marchantia polymorpha subsp. ruderalis TaxID=1480154 RepID=A0A176WAK5_MARPO|nr:hypothetical protein AXG93_1028s1030 [Marchantia polymorpha subsp. ruderalis]
MLGKRMSSAMCINLILWVQSLTSESVVLTFLWQEELGHKIIGVEELSLKLLQRLMYAGRVMESSAAHLKSVHALQVEVTDMKRTLTETISNYEKLCQKVETMGLHKRNIKPMSISSQSQFGSQDSPIPELFGSIYPRPDVGLSGLKDLCWCGFGTTRYSTRSRVGVAPGSEELELGTGRCAERAVVVVQYGVDEGRQPTICRTL